ncbi:MAG: hypothetical protein BRD28_02620 [Bacteroidetes bacterium QH_10_64_37]|nr:MAG: hypothetical protein BRD28_02620 [Bacteroidetes bacterium QH_10_64_37]
MQVRDTEGSLTKMRERLFNDLGVVDIQGVLMNQQWEPTACVEAIDYASDEEISPRRELGRAASRRKTDFAKQLSVPFYVVTSINQDRLKDLSFAVFEFRHENDSLVAKTHEKALSGEQFADFWADLKGTDQTKGLPDAGARIQNSNVDQVLDGAGLAWGGNVDGVLFDASGEVKSIIEVRKTTRSGLDEYDPSDYFHYRGGDYNTWKPLFRIAHRLEVPLVLLTFKRGESKCGFARLRRLSSEDGIEYHREAPCDNLLSRQQAKHTLKRL